MGGFVGFENREDKGMFPDSGQVGMVKGKIIEGREEKETFRANIFKMKRGEVIRTKGRRVFGGANGIGSVIDRERGEIRRQF